MKPPKGPSLAASASDFESSGNNHSRIFAPILSSFLLQLEHVYEYLASYF